jgi:hypothetical protein
VNKIVFLSFFSVCSLLVYRKAIDFFCMLILYLTTLPKKFIRTRKFLVESLKSFKYRIRSPANMDYLTSSFLMYILFIFFFCLIALAKNSSSVLNKSGESGHPCPQMCTMYFDQIRPLYFNLLNS